MRRDWGGSEVEDAREEYEKEGNAIGSEWVERVYSVVGDRTGWEFLRIEWNGTGKGRGGNSMVGFSLRITRH